MDAFVFFCEGEGFGVFDQRQSFFFFEMSFFYCGGKEGKEVPLRRTLTFAELLGKGVEEFVFCLLR